MYNVKDLLLLYTNTPQEGNVFTLSDNLVTFQNQIINTKYNKQINHVLL